MPINTMLNLKSRLREKEAHKINGRWILFWCNIRPSAGMDFCGTHHFPGTLIDFRFSDVYQSFDERFTMHVNPCP